MLAIAGHTAIPNWLTFLKETFDNLVGDIGLENSTFFSSSKLVFLKFQGQLQLVNNRK